jgi:hypothetical protein
MPSLHEIEQRKAREREALYREQMRQDGDHQVTGSADPEWQDVVFSHMDVIDADYYDEIDYDEVEDAPDGEDV